MAGFDLFTSIKTIPGVEFVTFAVLAGCKNPAEVSAYMHTLPEYPYIDTDIVLESITDEVRELTGYALIGTLETERQIAIDTIKGELGEWK